MNMSLALPSGILKIWEQVKTALDVVRPDETALQLPAPEEDLVSLCEILLARREENAGVKLVAEILDKYQSFSEEGRCRFLNAMADNFGPDLARLDTAVLAYQASPDDLAYRELQAAVEPRRQRLIRLLNFAPQGTFKIVQMRADAIRIRNRIPRFAQLDSDFVHIFRSWFNRGFLVLKQIDWSSPAQVLAKIIHYEAVHDIKDWSDLQSRIDPEDRRCFAFFHPQIPDEPLIFIEVALTLDVPSTIESLLTNKRAVIRGSEARTAVFYSISNCNIGLRGIPFGNFLVKHVVEVLQRELPALQTFVTLSPLPGFAAWLAKERKGTADALISAEEGLQLTAIDNEDWHSDAATVESIRPVLLAATARYLLRAKDEFGLPPDPVARFHLGNGARLNRINLLGDVSPRGMRQAQGFMVNYLYDLKTIETNQEAIAVDGTIDSSAAVRDLLRVGGKAARAKRTAAATA
ncbi:MAG: MCD, Malonyl-CoA decarboxylase MCD [Rhodospirillaceae bacterium]|nr:MCD, Malonyl-CoA decarboxylase MCD [Rhodospirillaceae bacterium]